MMQTTLTLDDRLLAELKRIAQADGKPLKQVVNETLRAGLSTQTRRPAQSYRLKPAAMGQPAADIDLVKARRLSDQLDDDANRLIYAVNSDLASV